jgi:O-antigen ligase
VRTPADVRAAIRVVVILAIVKSAIGVLALLSGTGARAFEGGEHLTYYEPTANFLAMLLLLGLVAAGIRRLPVGWRLWLAGAITLLSLVLSFRRSFWIGTVAAIPILVLIATGRTGRRLLVPAATLVAVALYVMFSSGAINASVDSPVGKRLTSLSPSKLSANPEDRYRIDERRNVVAELRDHPVAGLGMAQPWAARYPLSVEHEGGRFYVHFAALWWWLKMGVLGLVAYLGVIAAGVVLGLRIWRRATDEVIRVGGLATAMAFVGLALAEATATFLGAELRMTAIAGAFLGLLAAGVMTLEDGPVAD